MGSIGRGVCLLVVSFLLLVTSGPTLQAAELTQRQTDLFENHVRPVFVAHCIKCHGETKQEGGLKLTTMAELQSGGDSGPAIIAGDADESLIIQAVRYESFEMPPDDPIKADLVDGLVAWVAAGAPWPDDVVLAPTPTITDEDRDWWCYQPLAKVDLSGLDIEKSEADWARNEIDAFIASRLAEHDLQPADEATPIELARRASFAITGLPPSQKTVAAIHGDAGAGDFDYDAYVDALLDDPAYGENQARLWLDLVRYADTDGYRADFNRPDAFEYRDYVIRSFRDDKPYDRFVREQLAGDEIDPGNRDAVIATMYLRHWIYEHNQRDVETQWHEILGDITETTADVFLAQGLKCARCHDHKFDPLLQKDYFRMKAFFAAFQPVAEHPVADVAAREAYQLQWKKWADATREIRDRLRAIEYPVALKHATREGFEKFIPEIQEMIKTPADQREPYAHQIATMAERQFDLPYDKLDEWLSEDEKAERAKLKEQLAALSHLKPEPLPRVKFVATDVGPVAPVTFNPDDADKKPIAPGYITLLDDRDAMISPPVAALKTTGRRTALANWIVSPDNPLTARVIVNRIWQQHFGRGLVATSSDFGRLGAPPTHPMLLDYLARRLMDDGWSLKKLHRLILTSATYRQSSRRPIDRVINRIDPQNELLWRMNPRRLTGEEINDAILTASGELKKQKRAIYKPVKRNSPDPLLKAFDGPDRIRSSGRRHRTTTSTQSLLLANSQWAHDRAQKITDRLADSPNITAAMFITRAYTTLFGRQATAEELELSSDFVQQYIQQTPIEKPTPPPPPASAKLSELPGKLGLAVDLDGTGMVRIDLPGKKAVPQTEFTIESTVLLRSLYKDASVRTIATNWTGSKKDHGWSLGVTSEKSAFKPRNLILQLIGRTDAGKRGHYEVIASGLRVPLNKPCRVAVSIDLADPSRKGITFYLRDLSDPQAKWQTASATHTVTGGIAGNGDAPRDLGIGSRGGKHAWDGLIGSVRIENVVRDLSEAPQADSDAGLPEYTVDLQFKDPKAIGHDSSPSALHADVTVNRPATKTPTPQTPQQRARVALVHALLNSNELIYVD